MTEKLIEDKKRIKHTMREFNHMLERPNNHTCIMMTRNLGYKFIEIMNSYEDRTREKQRKKQDLRCEIRYKRGATIYEW